MAVRRYDRRRNCHANLYSIIETCKANEIEPYPYLVELFRALARANTVDDCEALLPWNMRLPATR